MSDFADLFDPLSHQNGGPSPKEVVTHLRDWRAALLNRSVPLPILDVQELSHIPSRIRCQAAFKTAEGKQALKTMNMSADKLLGVYDILAPRFLSILYAHIQAKPKLIMSDLPIRLAQTAFELNLLHDCCGKPSGKVLDRLGEDSMNDFEAVRSKVADSIFFKMQAVIKNHGTDVPSLCDKFDGATSSGDFLNEVFRKVSDQYAMELMNAMEFAGYDLDDPKIARETLSLAYATYQQKDSILVVK